MCVNANAFDKEWNGAQHQTSYLQFQRMLVILVFYKWKASSEPGMYVCVTAAS